ncbi:MAG: CotH kinase family protein [Clostridia bacterium]|nr:CotH kinase family protein [Clostridia bacterium]
MSKTESYEYLAERIDVISLIDWYCCRFYMGDRDLANIRRFRTSEGDGKWHWMWYDLDWAFYHTTDVPLDSILSHEHGDTPIINALLESTEGKDAFLKRYAELMNTILNDEYFGGVLDKLVAAIESEIPNDRMRWGTTVATWERAIRRVRKYTENGKRTEWVLEELKSYFGLSDKEMTAYFGELYR